MNLDRVNPMALLALLSLVGLCIFAGLPTEAAATGILALAVPSHLPSSDPDEPTDAGASAVEILIAVALILAIAVLLGAHPHL